MNYQYLASPYTDPNFFIQEQRYLKVLEAMYRLTLAGKPAYSPVIHFHELAKMVRLSGRSDFWDWHNRPMLVHSSGLIILKLPGWGTSTGVCQEIGWAEEFHLPVVLMDEDSGDLEKMP